MMPSCSKANRLTTLADFGRNESQHQICTFLLPCTAGKVGCTWPEDTFDDILKILHNNLSFILLQLFFVVFCGLYPPKHLNFLHMTLVLIFKFFFKNQTRTPVPFLYHSRPTTISLSIFPATTDVKCVLKYFWQMPESPVKSRFSGTCQPVGIIPTAPEKINLKQICLWDFSSIILYCFHYSVGHGLSDFCCQIVAIQGI